MDLPYLGKLRGPQVQVAGVPVPGAGRVATLNLLDSQCTYNPATGVMSIGALPGGPSGVGVGSKTSQAIRWRSSGAWAISDDRVYYAADYGAAGNGTTDDTVAVQACIADAAAVGGTAQLMRYHRITAGLTIPSGIVLRGMGNGLVGAATHLIQDTGATAIDLITVSAGSQNCIIKNLYIRSNAVHTTGVAINLDGTYDSRIEHVTIADMCNGLRVKGTHTTVENYQCGNIYGTYGIWFIGAAGSNSHSLQTINVGCNVPHPLADTANPGRDWATGLTIATGDVVYANGNLYQASQGGTTAGSGSGPSGIPTTNPNTARTTDITDNTVKWRYVCSASLWWYRHDSYAYSWNIVGRNQLLNGHRGIWMGDSVSDGSSAPLFMYAGKGLEIDHPYQAGVYLQAGAGANFTSAWISSVFQWNGFLVASTFTREWAFTDCEVYGCAEDGIAVGAGQGRIVGGRTANCGSRLSNSYDGIRVDAGVSNVSIIGVHSGAVGAGGDQMRYGVNLKAGAGDNITVIGCTLPGNLTGGINRGATGASVVIGPNRGSGEEFLPNQPDHLFDAGFGDGSDGDLTVSSGTTAVNAVKYYRNVTITGTAGVRLDAFSMYVSGTLDLSNAPANALFVFPQTGGNAAGATHGSASAPGTGELGVGGSGTSGADGATGAGAQAAAPTNQSPANGGAGGAGGAGGTAGANTGGASRAGATVSSSMFQRPLLPVPFLRGASLIVGSAGGAGGGAGGGDGTNAGGGGGAGGGCAPVCVIRARYINRGTSTAAGAVTALGGNGGNGAVGVAGNAAGGAGGGGGGGGYIVIVAGRLLGAQKAGAISAAGGGGGNAGNGLGTGTGGDGGTGGSGGGVMLGELATNTWTKTTGSAASAGGAHSGTTGGTGSAGGACSAAL